MNISELLKLSIAKGNIDTIERLMVLRDKIKLEKSKEEFDKSFRAFQEECPVIERLQSGNKTNLGESTFVYAPLDYIIEKVRSVLTKNNFSWTWEHEFLEGAVKVTCIANHVSGYSKKTTIIMPLGTSTKLMGVQQIVGAAISYAERYSFKGVFGIVTQGEDNEKKLEEGRKKTQNENAFFDAWAEFENMINILNEKLTAPEKESISKMEMAKDVNKLSLKSLNEFIDYLKKKYPATKSNITIGE
ncbi:MAG: ERF family protein [Lutibacter sp.]